MSEDRLVPSPGPGPASARLEARGLSVAFGDRVLLSDVSFSVPAGGIVVIEGPSGGGKSTLLRALAGLEPLASGTVLLDGTSSLSLPPESFRRRVAYVAQLPVTFPGTVSDNVRAGPRLAGRDLAGDAVDALLRRAALDPSMAPRTARDLSGGEKQRVAIARALANDPDVLLFDESTSALDPQARDLILECIRRCAADGHAVVVVTHTRADADALGGLRWVCDGGRLLPKSAP